MSDSGTIAFIGGGNMARSLIGGLLGRGTPARTLQVAEPDTNTRDALAHDFGIPVFADASEAVRGAATWLLAVKPQVAREVCESLAATAASARPLLISIAAGIDTKQLARWLGPAARIVRCMPNLPALLGAGMTGVFAAAGVRDDDRERVATLLAGVGETAWIDDESQMDVVTAVSGSGPAHVFLLAEAMQHAAVAQGLSPTTAHALVTQTVLGAACMLAECDESAAELRRRVTSPGGTTEAAIETLETGGLRRLVLDAVTSSAARSRALAAANRDD